MILTVLVISLTVGGLLAWLSGRWSSTWPRIISLITLSLHLIALIALWIAYPGRAAADAVPWIYDYKVPWIPQLGINFHLSMDGLSLLLVVLTTFLGIMAVAASWQGIQYRVGFFHFNLLWMLSAIVGVFMATDLFLFYFFWEMMLVPLYFLIGIWGHENRVYATLKFFIFTQASSLFMLLSILALYLLHGQRTGTYTFEYLQLIGERLPQGAQLPIMLGFFLAFAVKLPMVPLHTWLPDAHTEASTAGSVALAGLVLKVGAYGFIRFVLPMFPEAARAITPVVMGLSVAGILYGAVVAYGQTDFKRMVAYTSVSHMGFVLLGIFAWNELALQGAIMVMLAHGVSTGALFIISGDLGDRMHTRDLQKMGGLWPVLPRIGGSTLFFALASLGLPGLGNFVGEILVLLGTYRVSPAAAILASLGFIISTVYSLWLVQAAFYGPNTHKWVLPRSNARETAIMAAMMIVMLWLGLYPQSIFATSRPSVQYMLRGVPSTLINTGTGSSGQTVSPGQAVSAGSAGQAGGIVP